MKNQFIVFSTIMVTSLLIFPIIPQAKEQTIDLTICAAGTCDNLSEEKDWETESCELRGIGWSNNDYKPFETFTTFGKCILGVKNGKWDMDCFKKYLDSDGDYLIIRNSSIYGGTGKWEGVTGEVKSKWLRMGKSMPPNNFANCQNITGVFDIPE